VSKETVMIVGLLLLARFTAYAGKWEFAGVVTTGFSPYSTSHLIKGRT